MPTWTSQQSSDADRLPTINQWMKTVSKEALEPVRVIKTIWCPNLYTNYSLDTESFRLRVSPENPLFSVLEDNLDEWVEQGTVIAIQIEGVKKPKIHLMTLDNESGEWDALGDFGWKLSNLERKKNVPPKNSYQRKQTRPVPEPSQDDLQDASS